MSPRQAVIYTHARAPEFAERAAADAAVRFPDLRCVQRNPRFFAAEPSREDCVAVYVEARFANIVDAYRDWGIPVVTDADLAKPTHSNTQKEQPHGNEEERRGPRAEVDHDPTDQAHADGDDQDAEAEGAQAREADPVLTHDAPRADHPAPVVERRRSHKRKGASR